MPSIARVSPSSRMLYILKAPLMLVRLNRRGLDRTVNPVAAALTGSPSSSAPMETLPSATSVRNLTAAL